MFKASALATALVVGILTTAGAQPSGQPSPRQVFGDIDLLGTWATDCSKPIANDNIRTIFKPLANGNVERTYFSEPNKIYSRLLIVRASKTASDQIVYEQQFDADLQYVTLKKTANRYRIFSNYSRAGKAYVENGVYVKDSPVTHGTETPWQTKCSNATS